jgi:hypothetical protein
MHSLPEGIEQPASFESQGLEGFQFKPLLNLILIRKIFHWQMLTETAKKKY